MGHVVAHTRLVNFTSTVTYAHSNQIRHRDTCGEGRVSRGQMRAKSKDVGAVSHLQFWDFLYILSHGYGNTHRNQILHGDQTR